MRAVEAAVVDARDEFAEGYRLPTVLNNALYMDRYLVSAISRPSIVSNLSPRRASTAAADRRARLHQGQRPGPVQSPASFGTGFRGVGRWRLRVDVGRRSRSPRRTRSRSTSQTFAVLHRPPSQCGGDRLLSTCGMPQLSDIYALHRRPHDQLGSPRIVGFWNAACRCPSTRRCRCWRRSREPTAAPSKVPAPFTSWRIGWWALYEPRRFTEGASWREVPISAHTEFRNTPT